MSDQDRPGRRQFEEALHRFRRARAAGRRPGRPAALDVQPTTPFELQILHQYNELRRDYEELKKRVDWLTLAILGAALTMVLERVFANGP